MPRTLQTCRPCNFFPCFQVVYSRDGPVGVVINVPLVICSFSLSLRYKYDWKLEDARKNLLRTHTTASTARMLYKLAQQVNVQESLPSCFGISWFCGSCKKYRAMKGVLFIKGSSFVGRKYMSHVRIQGYDRFFLCRRSSRLPNISPLTVSSGMRHWMQPTWQSSTRLKGLWRIMAWRWGTWWVSWKSFSPS